MIKVFGRKIPGIRWYTEKSWKIFHSLELFIANNDNVNQIKETKHMNRYQQDEVVRTRNAFEMKGEA